MSAKRGDAPPPEYRNGQTDQEKKDDWEKFFMGTQYKMKACPTVLDHFASIGPKNDQPSLSAKLNKKGEAKKGNNWRNKRNGQKRVEARKHREELFDDAFGRPINNSG